MKFWSSVGRLSRSLYARLALVYLLSLVAMSLATAWIAVNQFNQLGREWLQRNQIELAAHLAQQFREPLSRGLNSDAARQTAARIERINPALSIYVLDSNGRIVGAWGDDRCALGHRVSTRVVHELLSQMPMLPVYTSLPCAAGRNVFSVAHIAYGTEHRPGYLLITLQGGSHVSMAHMWKTSSILRSVLIAGIGALVLAAIVGLLLFAFLTRRFSRLTGAAQRFADGDYTARVAVGTDDEIGRTARAFNDMAATIEAQVRALRENDRQRRDLVANLSHDFRTPLTALRAHAEQMRDNTTAHNAEHLDVLLANVTRLTRLAEQLSLLSGLDVPEGGPRNEPFNLAELAQDIVGKFRSEAEAAGIELAVECTAPARAKADLELIDRALSNLIENALHATPEAAA